MLYSRYHTSIVVVLMCDEAFFFCVRAEIGASRAALGVMSHPR